MPTDFPQFKYTLQRADKFREALLKRATTGEIAIVLNRVASTRYNPYGYNLWKINQPAQERQVVTASR